MSSAARQLAAITFGRLPTSVPIPPIDGEYATARIQSVANFDVPEKRPFPFKTTKHVGIITAEDSVRDIHSDTNVVTHMFPTMKT